MRQMMRNKTGKTPRNISLIKHEFTSMKDTQALLLPDDEFDGSKNASSANGEEMQSEDY